MQANGVGPTQVTQVRGFADQRLRNLHDSLDPSNRRVSLIVHYLESNNNDEDAKPPAGGEEKKPEDATAAKPSAGSEEKKPEIKTPGAPAENPAKKE